MKKFSIVLLAMLVATSAVFATISTSSPITVPGGTQGGRTISTLDEQCVIDFVSFTTGTGTGTMTWPGGNGDYRLTGLCFTNSCTPGETFCTYCVDLNHDLMLDPYCVNIDSVVVRNAYPEQYPALAYMMTWYPVFDDLSDRIMQLSIWKVSNETRSGDPNFGVPYYYIDGGRGYPNIMDPPVFPYVNTVYNSDAGNNDPANTRVLDAIGYGPDGLSKNVALCDDQLLVAVGATEVIGTDAYVHFTVTLVRGARAIAVNNLDLRGVKLLLTVDNGTVVPASMHTNAAGQIVGTVSQPVGTTLPSNLRICTYSLWPREVVPCDTGANHQQLLVQSLSEGALCTLCVDVMIPPDNFLSVELTSFDAISRTNGIELNWSTASETNADRWVIERRLAGARDFNALAQVDAQNVATGASYSYLDRYVETGLSYEYRLVDIAMNGTRTAHDERIISAAAGSAFVPGYYELSDNFPNPFNPETTIRFVLGDQALTTLTIYDLTGDEVATLVNGTLEAGSHSVTFDAAALPSGTYFYKLVTPGFTSTKKMILMK